MSVAATLTRRATPSGKLAQMPPDWAIDVNLRKFGRSFANPETKAHELRTSCNGPDSGNKVGTLFAFRCRMSASVTQVVVLESGAKLPLGDLTVPRSDLAVPLSERALGSDHTLDFGHNERPATPGTCVVAQQAGEDDRAFRQRVAGRLRRLAADGVVIESVQMLYSGERGGESLERRLMLAQTLLQALPTSAEGELVLRGELGRSSAGQLDVWAIVETLTALPLGWATRVRALFESPAREQGLLAAAA
jgi:hypothetical protein